MTEYLDRARCKDCGAHLDMLAPYRKWRCDLRPFQACIDVDFVEYRNGRPAAFLELTRVYPNGPSAKALDGIYERLYHRPEGSGHLLSRLSALCGVPCYVVVYNPELSRFVVMGRSWEAYRACPRWTEMSPGEFRSWLQGLDPK